MSLFSWFERSSTYYQSNKLCLTKITPTQSPVSPFEINYFIQYTPLPLCMHRAQGKSRKGKKQVISEELQRFNHRGWFSELRLTWSSFFVSSTYTLHLDPQSFIFHPRPTSSIQIQRGAITIEWALCWLLVPRSVSRIACKARV
jgi:hypothetical protein